MSKEDIWKTSIPGGEKKGYGSKLKMCPCGLMQNMEAKVFGGKGEGDGNHE